MTATHGFTIDGVVTAQTHLLAAASLVHSTEGGADATGRGNAPAHSAGPASPVHGGPRHTAADQFAADLRGDHDGPASYAWLAEREAIASWEDSR